MSISGGVANRMDGCSSQLDEQCEQLNELIGELPEIVYQSQPTDAAASPARAGKPSWLRPSGIMRQILH